MVDICPTDEMLESEFAEVVTPDVVAIPVDRRNPYSGVPPFACDCCKDWSDNIGFLDKIL